MVHFDRFLHIRAHAQEFQIDPNKIIASGGSAGRHLAAATALTQAYNEASDDLTVSALPNALVLFNPVIDNGPGGGMDMNALELRTKTFLLCTTSNKELLLPFSS